MVLTSDIPADYVSAYSDSLGSLNLSSNGLTSLPPSLPKFKKLRKLNLASNNIESINHSHFQMISLCSIDLSHNKLSSLEGIQYWAPNVEALYLTGNKDLKDLSALGSLRHLKSLEICLKHFTKDYVMTLCPDLQVLNTTDKTSLLQDQLDAIKVVLKIQESALEKDDPNLLQTWRQKVFDLMLQIKQNDLSHTQSQVILNNATSALKKTLDATTTDLSLSHKRNEALIAETKYLKITNESSEEKYTTLAKTAASLQLVARSQHTSLRDIATQASTVAATIIEHQFLEKVSAKLGAYNQRLHLAFERLAVLSTLVSQKDVTLRNSKAALEAERRVWISKLYKFESESVEEIPDKKIIVSGLPSACRDALLHLFQSQDYYGKGFVSTSEFLKTLLNDDTHVSDLFTTYHQTGKVQWYSLLSQLQDRVLQEEGDNTITWGEFLLYFMPKLEEEDTSNESELFLPPPLIKEISHIKPVDLTFVDKMSRNDVVQELQSCLFERSTLVRRIQHDSLQFKKVIRNVSAQWKEKEVHFVSQIGTHCEKNVQLHSRNENLKEENENLRETITNLRQDLSSLETEFTQYKSSCKADANRLSEEAEARYYKLYRETEEAQEELLSENHSLKAENAKHVVNEKALERQVERLSQKLKDDTSSKVLYFEEKLESKDVEIAKLRRERNSLLKTVKEKENFRFTSDKENEEVQELEALSASLLDL